MSKDFPPKGGKLYLSLAKEKKWNLTKADVYARNLRGGGGGGMSPYLDIETGGGG